MSNQNAPQWHADAPLLDPKFDQLQRRDFARQIAEQIALTEDARCIVTGIYGAWGDGKTTLLHFIQEELRQRYSDSTISVHYSPWRVGHESLLIADFLRTIANSIHASDIDASELAACLAVYSDSLALASVTLADLASGGSLTAFGILGIVKSFWSGLIAQFVQNASSTALESKKQKVSKAIERSGRRLVVFIDDLDRLDHHELHAMLKLIKTNADLRGLTYVIAIDDKMAAASLGRFYPKGGADAGSQFLEKIVQIPIRIPPPQRSILNARISDLLYDAYKIVGIELSANASARFGREIQFGISNWMRNLREAKRLTNTLIASLLRLRGEVDPVDLTIVEAIKIRAPGMYDYMNSHDEIFVGIAETDPRFNEFAHMSDYFVKARQNFLKETLPKCEQSSGIVMKATLANLFPRLHDAEVKLVNSEYPEHDDWMREQRIASLLYYRRYFELSIAFDETSDVEILDFLRRLGPETNDTAITRSFEKLVQNRNFFKLVRRLRSRVVEMDHITRAKLTRLIVMQGNDLKTFGSYPEAEEFVLHVIRNSERARRVEIAIDVVKYGAPKEMVGHIVHRLKKDELTAEENRLLSEDEERVLDRALAERTH
jgi:predicted KAP-like P-loop ATPase